MSKFLRIIENVTPEEVDKVSSLFNKSYVSSVNSLKAKDIILLTLTDGTSVSLKITDVTNAEEDNEQAMGGPNKLLSAKDRDILKAAGELGADPVRRTFGIGDPVKNLGKAVGDFYNKLAARLKNISSRMSV